MELNEGMRSQAGCPKGGRGGLIMNAFHVAVEVTRLTFLSEMNSWSESPYVDCYFFTGCQADLFDSALVAEAEEGGRVGREAVVAAQGQAWVYRNGDVGPRRVGGTHQFPGGVGTPGEKR